MLESVISGGAASIVAAMPGVLATSGGDPAALGIPALLLAGGTIAAVAVGQDGKPTGEAPRVAPRNGTQAAGETAGDGKAELRRALVSCKGAFIGIALFSALINVLMLTGSVFMLEVYDRVLPSRSVSTLIGICIVALILYAAQGLLDLVRGRLLVRAGGVIDEVLSARVFDAIVKVPIRAGPRGSAIQPLQDLDSIRTFLSGTGPTAFFDLPWLPLYLGVLFAFHPYLGWTAVAGAVVLIALTITTDVLARRPMQEATGHMGKRFGIVDAAARNAESLAGMGFAGRIRDVWSRENDAALSAQRRASDISNGLGAIARVSRMILQSAVLAMGAYLVIKQEASAGSIIAGSILAARALAPVDLAIANWRMFIAARQSWRRLTQLLSALPAQAPMTVLPAPCDRFQIAGVSIAPPGDKKLVVRDVGFSLNKGQALAVIGPSGSGKTSLARVLAGAWLPVAGSVRLDGAALDQWNPEDIGRFIGYLPQDVQLFAGTVAQNISRFDPAAKDDDIVKAAKAADVHELIVSLPKGYDTPIGDFGAVLSAGQRQRVALARALYGDPFLVILDEPDASLDVAGEQALREAILRVRARGGIVIVVSHRQALLGAVDMLLALKQGQTVALGPKEAVMQQLMRPQAVPVEPVRAAGDAGRRG